MLDARIDSIGYVDELRKQFADGLRDDVKAAMSAGREDRRQGESFDALLVNGTIQAPDADLFLTMYEQGQITRAQLVASITIKRDAALEFVSREALADISHTKPMPAQLRITRKKGIEPSLVQAITHIKHVAIGTLP